MNKNIQPNYEETTITCACGNVMTVGSTKKANVVKNMILNICSSLFKII